MTARSDPPARKPYDLATAEFDYPLWEGPPKRTILLCSHLRSGSTLLGEAIGFAGGNGLPLEYFHAGFQPTFEQRWDTHDVHAYIAAVHRHRTDVTGRLSVKLFWHDVIKLASEIDPAWAKRLAPIPAETAPEVYRELAAVLAPIFPNPSYVHLRRHDRARQAVSAATAHDTGLWRSIPGVGEQEPTAEPRYDYDRINDLIAFGDFCHGHWRNLFDAIGVTPHRVSYESLSSDWQGTVAGVFDHLGIAAPLPPVRMRRQSGGLSERMLLRFLRDHAARSAP